MYVTVCTNLFKLTPTMCLFKMSLLKYFYRMFFCFFLAGKGGVREGSIMSGLPHQFNGFSADTTQNQINIKADNYRKRHIHLRI